MKKNNSDPHTLVVGLGKTGLSVARWLSRQGQRITVADTRDDPPGREALGPDIELRLGPFTEKTFADADRLVVSPGLSLSTPAIAQAIARGIPVVGDIELFAQAISGTNSKVIAITGSNGKTTVTTMVGELCQAAGLKTAVIGNIGVPVLDALNDCKERGEWPAVWVMELSSFQLETTWSLRPDAAAILNVTEDHLDRYAGMKDYAAAKQRIFMNGGIQVLNREDIWCQAIPIVFQGTGKASAPTSSGAYIEIGEQRSQADNAVQTLKDDGYMAIAGQDVIWFGTDTPRDHTEYGLVSIDDEMTLCRGQTQIMKASELSLPGRHNAANALAAVALCQAIGIELPPLVNGLRKLKSLPHRLEWVADINGVAYYDDSKGTNVGATVAALSGMTRPVVLIAGGDGKGQDFSPLLPACARICRAVVLIGRDSPRIAAVLNRARSAFFSASKGEFLPVHQVSILEIATQLAAEIAQPGDTVLLSPACASWDMFRDYVHRAEVFIRAVKALESHVE